MKTIVRAGTNISLYLFDQNEEVTVYSDHISVGNPVRFNIGDCSSSNAILYENVSNPGDWSGWKYFYTPENGWALNPDWVPLPPPPQ